jgi:hypothetical protein
VFVQQHRAAGLRRLWLAALPDVWASVERGARAAGAAAAAQDGCREGEDGDVSTVNHPDWYNKHPTGVECIDIIECFSFNIGSAMKYLWRAGLKTGDPIEDLEKAAWYCQREVERVKKERMET